MTPSVPSTDAWGALVARASTLNERLASGFVPHEADPDTGRIAERLARWREVVARGEAARFERRLAFGGLRPEALQVALGDVRLTPGQPLPAWSTTLRALVEATAAHPFTGLVAQQDARPFEDLFVPVLKWAWVQVLARVGSASLGVTAGVRRSLRDGLLGRLLQAATPCLQFEFALQRRAWPATSGGRTSRESYRNFVQTLRNQGLWPLFQDYPVLARQVAVLVEQWVDSTAEVLTRLEQDREALAQCFFDGRPPGALREVSPALSDAHHGGRAVHILTFEHGLKVVYKPRDLGIEVAYGRLVTWLEALDQAPSLRAVRVLPRDGYGWAEWVSQAPCADEAEAREYYRRAGALVALTYLLGTADCLVDNVIAAGATPVLIDVETLMQPWTRVARSAIGGPPGSVQERTRELHQDSVLRSGLLPAWSLGADPTLARDSSGLDGAGGQVAAVLVPRWDDVNTDAMALRYENAVVPESRNRPVLAGQPLKAAHFARELDEGFTAMYRLFMRQREALLAEDGPLRELGAPSLRFLFRNTQAYANVLKLAQQPRHLMDGVDHAIELDVLTRDELALSEERPAHWPVLELEREALERCDIPRFALDAREVDWSPQPGVLVPDFFEQACHAQVLARVRRLGEEDLAIQRALLRGALHASVARRVISRGPERGPNVPPLQPDEALEAALQVSQRLREACLRTSDGGALLPGLEYLPGAERFPFRVLTPGVCAGAGGVAVFLADVASQMGDEELRGLAVGLLASTRAKARRRPVGAHANELGLGSGIGASIWSLVRVARATGHDDLLEDARLAAQWITPEALAADTRFDVMGGAAGALIALLALHASAPDAGVLSLARACGERLLTARSPEGEQPRAWATVDGQRLTGFSHGAAGIALALLRLHAATGEAVWRDAALEAIAYESALFSPAHDNWPDLRVGRKSEEGRPSFGTTWCHGAPGIALARVGGLSWADGDGIRRDITAALRTVERTALETPESLCCGNAGRIEALLVCGQRMERPEWVESARRLAAGMLARAGGVGAMSLLAGLPSGESALNPGLFTGLAGVGHVLLRLARPVPSVLLFE